MNDTLDNFRFSGIEELDFDNSNNGNDRNGDPNLLDSISLDDTMFLDAEKVQESILNNTKTNYVSNTPASKTNYVSNTPASNKLECEKFQDSIVNLPKNKEGHSCKSLSNVDAEKINESLNTEKSVDHSIQTDDHLSNWGLPEKILKSYEKRKITTMFQWQLQCLNSKGIVEQNRNLVYSAPTSAGKTLVAEILAMKCLFERRKKVLLILPFISVVREKVYYFQDILSSTGKRVEGFMGSYNPPGGFQSVHMAIGTIEKCNSLVNRLLEEEKLDDLGLVIIDEIHLVGDPHRGYLLELLLTKLKYIMLKHDNVKIQLIGMSATLPNLDSLAQWLDAELYTTNFRPIPLQEMIYMNRELFDNELKLLKSLPILPELATDTDDVLQLCLETIEKSCSVLIFCPTKNWCENLAQQIASAFCKIGRSATSLSKILHKNLSVQKIMEILEQLKYCPSGLDKILKSTVAFGVAFHHAGLTMEERDIIEGGFRNGGIRLLIATSTLSSGVNLPARRVIIRSPIFHGKSIDIQTYRQMIGRAGRMGIDTEGESILICQKSNFNTVKSLVQSSLNPIQSCLHDIGKFKRAILEIIASGVASSAEDMEMFEKSTLAFTQKNEDRVIDPVGQVVEFLLNFQFIRLQKMEDGTNKYVPTPLGKACLSSSLPPGDGLELFAELEKARRCFVLETELHLIYLVTPYSACYQWATIDWMFYLELWEKLPLSMKKVGELVGVRESFLINATRGKFSETPKLMIHKRFFVALILQDLVNEKSLDEVSKKYSCNRGVLQSLQQSASTFAGMVTAFSRKLGWSSVELLISQFQDRLQFGVNRDLLDLMRLPCLNSMQARALYRAGIETLINIANSDVCTIENILHKVVPFENIKAREGESEHEFKQRSKLRTVWITGRQGLTEREAAILILEDARKYLEHEMGVQNIEWGHINESLRDKNKISVSTSDDSSFGQVSVKCKDSLSFIDDNEKQRPVITSETCTERVEEIEYNQKTENKENFDEEQQISVIRKSNGLPRNNLSSQPIFELSENNNENTKKYNVNLTRKTSANIGIDIEKFKSLKIMSPQRSIKNIPMSNSKSTQKNEYLFKYDADTCCKNREVSIDSSSEDDLFEHSIKNTIDKVPALTVQNTKRLHESGSSPDVKKMKIHPTEILNEESNLTRVNLDSSEVSVDLSKIFIIDVCKHQELLNCFKVELLQHFKISLSLAVKENDEITTFIGLRKKSSDSKYKYLNKIIEGIAITWDGINIFYLNLETINNLDELSFITNYLKKDNCFVEIFDSKETLVLLQKALGIEVYSSIGDPLVIDWLLDPDDKDKNLNSMIFKYCPEAKGIFSYMKDNNQGKLKASIESVITWNLSIILKDILNERTDFLFDTYRIEMSTIKFISKMEIEGIGADRNAMESLITSIRSNMKDIERKIYNMAGRKFVLSSSKEVAKVIGLGRGPKISARKQLLQQSKLPVSDLILLWRKLSCTISKMLTPLMASVGSSNRIYGKYITNTSTGRLSMSEPNIQNVAKDFDFINPITKEKVFISCRSIFVAKTGYIFLSTDYCQLELRMLAHFSRDELLCNVLKSEGDIFKTIAANWNHIPANKVTDQMRTQTKQICYGIIYGIGSKALAEQLGVDVQEATVFMETFKDTYPGIRIYIQTVIEECKKNGFVETLSHRRRFLPHIDNDNPAIKSHAERQAVNTTIQGSAADLVKLAMKKILETMNAPSLVLHLHDELLFEVPIHELTEFASMVKECMEKSIVLSVPFTVKQRAGNSWGVLKEL